MNRINQDETTKTWVRALFSTKRPDDFILVWTATGQGPDPSNVKASYYFDSVSTACEKVAELAKKDIHVYAGMGLGATAGSPTGRFGNADVVAIPGLWIDIDFAGDAHKKENLPETEAEAITLLRTSIEPFKPTLVTRSGNGIHGYVLFKEVFEIESEEDRASIELLLRRFQGLIRKAAHRFGWAVDYTHDLARVMRVAGTRNIKLDPPTISSIVSYDAEYRPDPFDLREFLDELPPDAFAMSSAEKVGTDEISKRISDSILRWDPNADVPASRFSDMMEYCPQARKSWEMNRADWADQSPSSYDFSLAHWARSCGWDDQSIVNLIIAFRRKHFGLGSKGAAKALRRDYTVRMLMKLDAQGIAPERIVTGRDQVSKANEAAEAEYVAAAPNELQEAEDTGSKEILRKALRAELGFDFKSFHTWGQDDVTWELEMLDGRRKTLGRTKDLFRSVDALNIALIESLGVRVRRQYTKAQWSDILIRIRNSAEHHELTYNVGMNPLVDYLRNFLQANFDDDNDRERDTKVSMNETFADKGFLYLNAAKFFEKPPDSVPKGDSAEIQLRRMGLTANVQSAKTARKVTVERAYYVGRISALPEEIRRLLGSKTD